LTPSATRRPAARPGAKARRRPGKAAASRPAETRGWSVYILRCADGTLYTGMTVDLARRLASHAAGTASRCTRARLPVTLAYVEPQTDRGAALRREAAVKRLRRAAKLALCAAGKVAPDAAPRASGARRRRN